MLFEIIIFIFYTSVLSFLKFIHCIKLSYYKLTSMLFSIYFLPTPATLTEGFPCFFLSCKANAGVYLAKTGQDRHSSLISELCFSMYCLCRLCCTVYCLCVNVYSTILLPPGVNPFKVKCIISHIISHHIILYHIIT